MARPRMTAERFWSMTSPEPNTGCWLWTAGCDAKGYAQVRWHGRHMGGHRLAFFLTRGRWPSVCALHRCDCPLCVNPDHLFEGTRTANNADRDAKGRQRTPRGERHPWAKLTDDQVREIRRRYVPRRVGTPRLGREYGVRPCTIWDVVHGKSWSHVA